MRSLGLALIGGAIIASCLLIAPLLDVPFAVAEDIETRKACDSRGCYVISKRPTKPSHESQRDDGVELSWTSQ